MQIRNLSDDECREFLSRTELVRLACASDNQPYVVPILTAYEDGAFYFLSTVGQKIEWLRDNPKACVQADEIKGREQWTSVIATGTFEELTEPQFTEEREHARELLEKRPKWWLNALGERRVKAESELIDPLYFRIRVEIMSGLRAQPDS